MSAPDQFRLGSLWSLLEMLRIYAERFVILAARFADYEVGYYYKPNIGDGSHLTVTVLTDAQRSDLEGFFLLVAGFCDDLDLGAVAAQYRRAIDDPPQTEREFKQLRLAFEDGLGERVYFALGGSQARYYEKQDDLLSAGASVAFPTAHREMARAARAYAFDLPIACVFHCMRALEPVLVALAKNVKEGVGVDNWNTVIDRIEARIRAIGKTARRGPRKNERLQFLSNAAMEFVYFKDGWRNYVSHGRGSYDQTEAQRVMDHVSAFIERVAKRLHE